MFYLHWAFKNLYNNKKHSLETVLFIAIISMVFFLNLALIKGSREQMKQTLENYMGDVSLDARSEDYSLAKVRKELESGKYRNSVKMLIGEYSIGNVEAISNNAYLSDANIKGYSSNYFRELNNRVEWTAGSDSDIYKTGYAILERGTAADLGVSEGDNVTVEFKTREGAINTATYKICGIFIGNRYLDYNALYVGLKDARSLGMVKDNYLNHIKVFLKNADNIELQNIVDIELKPFSGIAYIEVWKWDAGNVSFYRVFQFSRTFFTVIITFISIVLLIVLFFGIQNVFFLNFSKRSNEISVLTTYGMAFMKIYKLIFWEMIIYFISGLLAGFILAFIAGNILSGISMTQLSDQMVVVLGGPDLQFSFALRDIALVILFIFLSGLYASIHSLRKYFKLEVREMKAGIG